MTFGFSGRAGAILHTAFMAAALTLMSIPGLHAGTLNVVKQRGKLLCGVSQGLAGFSAPDASKKWSGFDVDFCRAVAAAVFGDGNKVDFVSLNAVDRFGALSSGKIDILSRNTTWTLARDVERGLDYVGISYFDGQGFMVHVDKGLSTALQLDGEKLCVLAGTTTIDNARAFFERGKMKVEILEFAKRDDALNAYEKGECTAFTSDRSALASMRTKLAKADDHRLLPEVISKEPLGPVVRQDDPSWSELTRWILFLLVNAEEVGWSQASADNIPATSSLTIPATVAAKLGLKESWARDVIKAVGNYGEIFDRNLGKDSPLKLERGLNALWTRGGILYAPPMR
jgi:general L-amino acid transport system substrate-binding protein